MTICYVGLGGSDAASGLSWALRKLTLTGAEDTPVAAGDTIYVGPGTYRETLTCDVAGSAGNPITYIGDVSGANTDGVGGIVRVTGSNNDTTATQTYCISGNGKHYRTFKGFSLDFATTNLILFSGATTDIIIENCTLSHIGSSASVVGNTAGANWIVRKCLFTTTGLSSHVLYFNSASKIDNKNILIENCIFVGNYSNIYDNQVGGITINNCTFIGGTRHVIISGALNAGQIVAVNNCILHGATNVSLQAITSSTEITENYNAFSGNVTDRTVVGTGANSNTYHPLFNALFNLTGYKIPDGASYGQLSPASPLRAIAGTSMATEDFYGITRPTTDSKKSWGAVQYADVSKSATQAHTGTYSLKIADAGRTQFRVPITNTSTTFNVYVYSEADYTGTKPQMIIKQPGQADTTVTDTGATGGWNLLTATLTPAAVPQYVIVEFCSDNTATAGSYATYWDDLEVV